MAQDAEIIQGGQLTSAKVDFDEPIRVVIPWPASVKSNLKEFDLREIEKCVSVYMLKSPQKPSVERFPGTPNLSESGTSKPDEKRNCIGYSLPEVKDKRKAKWEEANSDISVRADSAGLLSVIDKLKPNQFYQFVFLYQRGLTKKEKEDFRKVAFDALDKSFRKKN